MRLIRKIKSGWKIKKKIREILLSFLKFSFTGCLISAKDSIFEALPLILFLSKVRSPFKFYFEKFPFDGR
jgi:hypothetical protein